MKAKLVKVWRWTKAVAVPLGGAALTYAAQGYFGPKAAVAAAAVSTLIGLFTKRPQDPHTAEETETAAVKTLSAPARIGSRG